MTLLIDENYSPKINGDNRTVSFNLEKDNFYRLIKLIDADTQCIFSFEVIHHKKYLVYGRGATRDVYSKMFKEILDLDLVSVEGSFYKFNEVAKPNKKLNI
jgi:hypothetical protein